MLPYIEQPVWHLGPLTIHAFGVAVAAAVWVGTTMGQRRFAHVGLDAAVGHRLGWWMIVGRFAISSAVILLTAWACWSGSS